MQSKPEVTIYTDGACSGNPGKGGYGAVLEYSTGGRVISRELSGAFENTTNNRMELTAAIKALSALKKPCIVTLISDSKYLTDAVNRGWLDSWKKNGWKKSDKKSVLNVDLWEELLELTARHEVKFEWIKGHAGHPQNERCDFLAVESIKSL